MSQPIYNVEDRPSPLKWLALSFQHVFAMFGATILVPLLTGLSPSSALFGSGIGTLLYILITGGKVPAYLGSSFAFIASFTAILGNVADGSFNAGLIPQAMGGAITVGVVYLIVAGIIKIFGNSWIKKVIPPVVIGAVIIVIGLNLAPVAMNMAMGTAVGPYSLHYLHIAAVTLAIAVVSAIVLKGFFTVIPILIAIVGGYFYTLLLGSFFPDYALINLATIGQNGIFNFPTFVIPEFNLVPMLTFALVSFATIAEHLGDTLVTSKIVGRDFYENPGLHRTLAGDGVATAVAALFGSPPNTTYGENIGVMAISRVYSVWVIGGAAVIALLLSFIAPVGDILRTIPLPVMGGVAMMLFGIIASAGIRTLVEAKVDYTCKRNLTISSIILVVGIGGGKIMFDIGDGLTFQLGGVALATLIGIILNLVLPPNLDKKVQNANQ